MFKFRIGYIPSMLDLLLCFRPEYSVTLIFTKVRRERAFTNLKILNTCRKSTPSNEKLEESSPICVENEMLYSTSVHCYPIHRLSLCLATVAPQ